MKKKNIYIASLSGGKDSVAMVHRIIKEGWRLDIVVFYDGGMEFKATYKVVAQVEKLCKKHGIKFVRLTPEKSFEYKAFAMPVNAQDGSTKIGYSWCGGCCRWATTDKLTAITKFYEQFGENEFIVEYVGIAADEKEKRLYDKRKLQYDGSIKLYPLVEWNMTEADCLQYCYAEGYHWIEREGLPDLYTLLKRVSCYCCRNKNLDELRNMFLYLPEYWEKLKEMQRRTPIPFYNGQLTIEDLEMRFKVEGLDWNFFDYAASKGLKL